MFDASLLGVGGGTSFGLPGMCSRFSADRLTEDKINRLVELGGFKSSDIISGTEPGKVWINKIPTTDEAWPPLLRTRVGLADMGMNYQIKQLAAGHKALKASGFQFGQSSAKRFYFDKTAAEADVKLFTSIGVHAEVKESSEFPGIVASITFPGGLINARQYCLAEAEELRANGAKIYERTKVDEIVIKNKKFKGVWANGQFHEADAVVIATCANRELLKPLDENIANSIAPFTGVSINIPISEEQAKRMPTVFQVSWPHLFPSSSFLVNVGVLDVPGGKELRVGGGFLAGVMQQGKVFDVAANALKRWVKILVPEYDGPLPIWQGTRSMTPHGLPYIGAVQNVEGVFLSIGQGSSGTSLCRGSAMILADIMERTLNGHEIQGLRYPGINLSHLLASNVSRERY